MLALSILTLGIYQLYWYVKTHREMIAIDPKVKILSAWLFIVPALVVITSLVVLIATTVNNIADLPSYCQSYHQSDAAVSLAPSECRVESQGWAMLFFYVSIIFIWPLTIVWLWSYSKGIEIVTKGKTSFAVALLILLVVPYGIDILIIQDTFNKLTSKT